MAMIAGFGFCFYIGFQISDIHSWLPFLAAIIGVDHMFVICSAVDQTKLENSAYDRIHEALSHAGPAITITTLTTCLAFLSGMLTSLQALRSFCMFATAITIMLYIGNLTFFLAVVVWDTRRVK